MSDLNFPWLNVEPFLHVLSLNNLERRVEPPFPVSNQQTCYWYIQLQYPDHWYKYWTGLVLQLSLEEQHWDGSPVRCSPIWYNPLSSALQTVLHWAYHEPALPTVGQLVQKDVVRNGIKSLAKIQNYVCHLPFIHKVRDLILEGYKIKQDHFMITAAKKATYCHIPHVLLYSQIASLGGHLF